MGQKINPHGFRVGVIMDWDSRWYARNDKVGDLIVEDYKIREYLKKTLYSAGVPKIEIERDSSKVRIFIHCSRPGVVIGKGGTEIERLVKQIEGLEEQELAVMYAIDEAKKKFATAEAVLKQNISGYEQRLRDLRDRDGVLRAELGEAEAAFQAARPAATEPALRLYDRVASQRFPACVPTHDGKCGGCHLKISGEIESLIRGKAPELATCDQCGRIVWWES